MKRILSLLLFVSFIASAQVKPGIEVLRDRGYAGLKGKRVALLTNPSGVDRNLNSTIDILFDAPEVNLVALFAPEHGVRGDIYAGDKVENSKDYRTGLPVYSLYGASRQPSREMLKGVDIVVYDIQDVGNRSYTFISTLGLMMRTCAEMNIPVMVLDRPNPLGGLKVEGPIARDGFQSFVGQYKIPNIYGLTVAELAKMINEEGLNCGQKGDLPALKCQLYVVPMEGWRRTMLYKDTGLPWVMPSPNIPTAESAIQYASAGICGEFYHYLNIGIGYNLPFGMFAAEWIDAEKLKERLESYKIPGVAWRCVHYKPFFGSSANKLIHGVQYYYTDYEKATVSLTQFYVIQAVNELYAKNPFVLSPERISMFNKICGSDYLSVNFSKTLKVKDMIDFWTSGDRAFRERSSKYYMYY